MPVIFSIRLGSINNDTSICQCLIKRNVLGGQTQICSDNVSACIEKNRTLYCTRAYGKAFAVNHASVNFARLGK